MFKSINLLSLEDFFMDTESRKGDFVFFYRFNGISNEVIEFLKKYYDNARKNGVIIDGRLQNPTPENLSYLCEMLGSDFKYDINFLNQKLKKWLPRISEKQCSTLCEAIFSTFTDMMNNGKTEGIIANAYIKYMCWLYYKFERIIYNLGSNQIPKILYFGEVSNYELQLLVALSRTGADVVLLNKIGEDEYLKIDNKNILSTPYQTDLSPFPTDFTLKTIQNMLARQENIMSALGSEPNIKPCTNAWLETPSILEILKTHKIRGNNTNFFYNVFIIQYGVEDPLTFSSDMLSFYNNVKNRPCVVVNNSINPPSADEISKIKRNSCQTTEQLISQLVKNINFSSNIQIENIIKKAFVDTVLSIENDNNLQKLTNKAVYLLCWINRYQKELFQKWSFDFDLPVFILFNPTKNNNEEIFLSFLSMLPVDVLIILPDFKKDFFISIKNLLEINCSETVCMNSFPFEPSQITISTAAYQAEREMDSLLYEDTGIYRNHQYKKANIITLQTMYEEIEMLWSQEIKYRTGFSTDNDSVCVPVIFSKICGVKNSNTNDYWASIKKLITPDTIVIKDFPYTASFNNFKQFAPQFLYNGKLQINKIKSHKDYQYIMLRDDVQQHIFEKIQLLIDEKMIKGTHQTGVEYSIISTALTLDKSIIRLIQKFDFTKLNPKIIFILTGERIFSLEDTITCTLLHLIGFDIIFFVPTGYQCIEQYFSKQFVNEYQIGDYMYDLQVPRFKETNNNQNNFLSKLFKRSF